MAVIAFIAILAGIISPLLIGEVEKKKEERAKKDVENIAKALLIFHATLGRWPAMDSNGNANGLRVLISGYSIPSSNPWKGNHEFWEWASGNYGDILANHMITNSPKGQTAHRYAVEGRYKWMGPYLDSSNVDPWGRPYIINVISGYSSDPVLYRKLWVLSAGPDGILQTSPEAKAGDEISGDDIGMLVMQR